MPYRFVEGVARADVAFEASGKTLEELFGSSGKALTRSMVENPESIESRESVKFSLKNDNMEKLLHDFLQEIIFHKDAESLIFNDFNLKVTEKKGECSVEAILKGEEIDNKKHHMIVDVKAVSWHMYKVEKEDEWKAFVILDV